jgi:hypothetical protein
MINKEELRSFLVKAKKATYAAGDDAIPVKEADGSTTLVFEDGGYRYRDNYFGGEPFGGREVVFFHDKPIYMMVYYGSVGKQVNDFKGVYGVLMNALKLVPAENPFRGPEEYTEDKMVYRNSFTGGVERFFGEESISNDGREIYHAEYTGGFIDKRD